MYLGECCYWECGLAGDSACTIPPQSIPQECLDVIRDWTLKLAKELEVVGLINIQYCIQDNQVPQPPSPLQNPMSSLLKTMCGGICTLLGFVEMHRSTSIVCANLTEGNA